MNIFYLDNDQEVCARWHCDKHVVKMILESAQMLCTAHWENDGEAPYKSTHKNHPSSVWTRASKSNYLWLCVLGKELCKEYTHRYEKIHKTESVIDWLSENIPNISEDEFVEPPKAMGDYKRAEMTVIENYKFYYKEAKKEFLNYKKRDIPGWIV